jgi:hypothetical protein
MSPFPLRNLPGSQDQPSENDAKGSLSTNQRVIGFTSRLKLPEAAIAKSRRRKTSTEPAPARVKSESELREEAAWKQVEETGKPVLLDGRLLVPDGMQVREAMAYLPDGVREQAIEDLDRKVAGALRILLDGAQNQLRENAKESGKLEEYDALHPIAKEALAESVVRKQMHMPEVPLEEIVDRMQKQWESNPEPGKRSKPAKVRTKPTIETDTRPKPPPVVIPAADLGKQIAPMSIAEPQESIRISQVSRWNLEHHGLLLKRLDQIWRYLTNEEQHVVLLRLGKDMGKTEIDEIDEIIKSCEWVRKIEGNANNV